MTTAALVLRTFLDVLIEFGARWSFQIAWRVGAGLGFGLGVGWATTWYIAHRLAQ